jgi:hypothetical protein
MDSYWDLYVAYVHHCVEYNKKHDIDPHHYEMEWNHFLPRCIFGDQPIGQYLLLKQHAIASALQTLAFNHKCMFGTHVSLLPEQLWELVRPVYCEDNRKAALVTVEKKVGIHNGDYYENNPHSMTNWTPEQRSAYAVKSHQKKDPKVRSENGRKAAIILWENMTAEQRHRRSLLVSKVSTESWALLSPSERETRLQNARKSLMKKVTVTLMDGTILSFDSISKAGEHFAVTSKVIAYLIKNGKSRQSLSILRASLTDNNE